MTGEDLGIARRHTGISGVVIAAWRGERGLMCRRMPAVGAIWVTIR
jgi:hypothetical protein